MQINELIQQLKQKAVEVASYYFEATKNKYTIQSDDIRFDVNAWCCNYYDKYNENLDEYFPYEWLESNNYKELIDQNLREEALKAEEAQRVKVEAEKLKKIETEAYIQDAQSGHKVNDNLFFKIMPNSIRVTIRDPSRVWKFIQFELSFEAWKTLVQAMQK